VAPDGASNPPTTSVPTTLPPTTAAPTTGALTTRPPTGAVVTTQPPTSAPAGSGGCSATYTKTGEWSGGFQGDVKVTNDGSTATTAWTVTVTFANGQRITQVWSGRTSSSASPYAVTNESYNNAVPAGGSTSFGFLGSWSATNANPTVSCIRTP
jgi:cellulase/cellobiase CelA1